MDTRNEDTMVRQIEKNLSNNISENLFLTGRIDDKTAAVNKSQLTEGTSAIVEKNETDTEFPLVSNEYINSSTRISRAEYIRQAREACLRQISAQQLYGRPYEVNYMEASETSAANEQLQNRKANEMKVIPITSFEEQEKPERIDKKEAASYHFLIIRCVCAVLLFLCVFLIDKFDIKIGEFSNQIIKDYVTGNDALKHLESLLVSWLK